MGRKEDVPAATAELWRQFAGSGDRAARRILFDTYLPLVRRIAATLFSKRVDNVAEFDDFFQYGTVGLLEALDRFDLNKGASFETFATYRIRGAILNGMQTASERSEIGSYRSQMARERVKSLQKSESGSAPADAFQEMVTLTMDLAIGFFLQDNAAERTESTASESDPYACEAIVELRKDIDGLIQTLPERERLILRYHYFQQLKFQQIAELLGLSKGRVSQLHRRALQSIRERCGPGRGVDSYL